MPPLCKASCAIGPRISDALPCPCKAGGSEREVSGLRLRGAGGSRQKQGSCWAQFLLDLHFVSLGRTCACGPAKYLCMTSLSPSDPRAPDSVSLRNPKRAGLPALSARQSPELVEAWAWWG